MIIIGPWLTLGFSKTTILHTIYFIYRDQIYELSDAEQGVSQASTNRALRSAETRPCAIRLNPFPYSSDVDGL